MPKLWVDFFFFYSLFFYILLDLNAADHTFWWLNKVQINVTPRFTLAKRNITLLCIRRSIDNVITTTDKQLKNDLFLKKQTLDWLSFDRQVQIMPWTYYLEWLLELSMCFDGNHHGLRPVIIVTLALNQAFRMLVILNKKSTLGPFTSDFTVIFSILSKYTRVEAISESDLVIEASIHRRPVGYDVNKWSWPFLRK